ncbi:hypothetical protein AVEN_241749-1 [Araneus ventricosus]|uniref:Uncharacterized protein n=1 Tax=Araneus ventricosus TaxID=182803 RepID=A0A4Y2RSJ6_ARAVE|nr:hypothetical protein AVEN_241749-1 [Araneus ventricosus]
MILIVSSSQTRILDSPLNLTIIKQWEIILPEPYSADLEELNMGRPAEDESDTSDLDGAVTEYSDHETDSEMDVEDNPI